MAQDRTGAARSDEPNARQPEGPPVRAVSPQVSLHGRAELRERLGFPPLPASRLSIEPDETTDRDGYAVFPPTTPEDWRDGHDAWRRAMATSLLTILAAAGAAMAIGTTVHYLHWLWLADGGTLLLWGGK